MSIKLLSASALALAITLAAVPAFAAITITEQRSVTVRYGDLDLSKPRDAQILLGRINRAAERACESPSDRTDLVDYGNYSTCVSDAIEQAVAQVPTLTAAYGTELAGSSVAQN